MGTSDVASFSLSSCSISSSMDEVTSDEGFVVLKPLELAYVVKCLSLASKLCCRAVLHELFKLFYMEVSWTTIFQIRIHVGTKQIMMHKISLKPCVKYTTCLENSEMNPSSLAYSSSGTTETLCSP